MKKIEINTDGLENNSLFIDDKMICNVVNFEYSVGFCGVPELHLDLKIPLDCHVSISQRQTSHLLSQAKKRLQQSETKEILLNSRMPAEEKDGLSN